MRAATATTEPADEGVAGFPCPECGGATEVIETRPRQGWLWRRRQCRVIDCRQRFSTHEQKNFWLSRHEGYHEGR